MTSSNPTQSASNYTIGIVLAGGAGERVGGVDKGLVIYQGRPLVEWVIDALETQVDDIILSVNRNQKNYQAFGFETVLDDKNYASFQGPIAGIRAAFQKMGRAEQHSYLVSSCDSPMLPNDYVMKLQQALDADYADAAIVHDGQRLQHLHCLIAGSAMPSLMDFFDSGGRAMHQWLANSETVDVDFSQQASSFSNINYQSQVA